MKTTEALKIIAGLVASKREYEKYYETKANRPLLKDSALRRRYLGYAKHQQSVADALEHLNNDLRILRNEVTTLSGMLDYCVNETVKGIELTHMDRKQVKAQLKVTKLVLKATSPR